MTDFSTVIDKIDACQSKGKTYQSFSDAKQALESLQKYQEIFSVALLGPDHLLRLQAINDALDRWLELQESPLEVPDDEQPKVGERIAARQKQIWGAGVNRPQLSTEALQQNQKLVLQGEAEGINRQAKELKASFSNNPEFRRGLRAKLAESLQAAIEHVDGAEIDEKQRLVIQAKRLIETCREVSQDLVDAAALVSMAADETVRDFEETETDSWSFDVEQLDGGKKQEYEALCLTKDTMQALHIEEIQSKKSFISILRVEERKLDQILEQILSASASSSPKTPHSGQSLSSAVEDNLTKRRQAMLGKKVGEGKENAGPNVGKLDQSAVSKLQKLMGDRQHRTASSTTQTGGEASPQPAQAANVPPPLPPRPGDEQGTGSPPPPPPQLAGGFPPPPEAGNLPPPPPQLAGGFPPPPEAGNLPPPPEAGNFIPPPSAGELPPPPTAEELEGMKATMPPPIPPRDDLNKGARQPLPPRDHAPPIPPRDPLDAQGTQPLLLSSKKPQATTQPMVDEAVLEKLSFETLALKSKLEMAIKNVLIAEQSMASAQGMAAMGVPIPDNVVKTLEQAKIMEKQYLAELAQAREAEHKYSTSPPQIGGGVQLNVQKSASLAPPQGSRPLPTPPQAQGGGAGLPPPPQAQGGGAGLPPPPQAQGGGVNLPPPVDHEAQAKLAQVQKAEADAALKKAQIALAQAEQQMASAQGMAAMGVPIPSEVVTGLERAQQDKDLAEANVVALQDQSAASRTKNRF